MLFNLNPHIEGPEPKFLVVLRCHINQANHDPYRNPKQLKSYYTFCNFFPHNEGPEPKILVVLLVCATSDMDT